VTEVRLADGLSLFVVHLAMSGRGRRRQLTELVELVGRRERAIVCGDFNAYDGLAELETLTDATGLVVQNPGETVPRRPLDTLVTDTLTLDLFLTSPGLTVTRCDVLDVQVSEVSFRELQTDEAYLEELKATIAEDLGLFNADTVTEVLSKYLGSSIRVE
jgi:endonuclease/exonuclease/phosphatase family metal-dependent hydrolase